jgi:hypothetical protein
MLLEPPNWKCSRNKWTGDAKFEAAKRTHTCECGNKIKKGTVHYTYSTDGEEVHRCPGCVIV